MSSATEAARYHLHMTPLRTAIVSQVFGALIAAAAIQIAQPKLFALTVV